MTPEEVVQAQVEAYNSRNITSFVACHHVDVELYQFSSITPFAVGRADVHKIYEDIFNKSPNLHSKIISRVSHGQVVIDKELITGRNGSEPFEMIAIYQVEDGFIRKAHFIR